MTQLTIDEILRMSADPSARKHKGNEQSVAAHKRILHTKADTYDQILRFIRSRGRATGFEVAAYLGKPLHAISGRLSELKAMNKLRKVG